jgi:hypothetical protein
MHIIKNITVIHKNIQIRIFIKNLRVAKIEIIYRHHRDYQLEIEVIVVIEVLTLI